MSQPLVIIVTGANRGIGRAICEQILSRPNSPPLQLFATSRKGEDLNLDAGGGAKGEIVYPKLDISSRESIAALRDRIESETDGHVSVLVNNAGVNLDAPGSYGPENAKKTLDVNFRGTVEMCQAFLPFLSRAGNQGGGRIVNLASVASSIKAYSPEIQARIRDASDLKELEQLAREFESSVSTSTEQSTGFGPPGRSYSVSKALLRSATNLLARQNPSLLINSCCPGWISTDMGKLVGSRPPKTPQQGAQIPVRLAVDGDFNGVSGAYFANDSVRSKERGRVQEWDA
ncbi:Hypothetical predicted protein [Lecanosticta acicola]|uniref:NAD(P)-binding protein n=1 Tax=Lecanosticta acicola TaxID=111012 RepID=A0AAI8YZE9_9PEZI|nr:Hypothetical predicted protein [Lecanosticta acicola]